MVPLIRRKEKIARNPKIFLVILLTLGFIGFMGGSSPLIAGQDDPPHQTHLTHARGPDIGTDCGRCHTGTPAYDNVNLAACNTCHSPGGAFDGVGDLDPENPDSAAFGAPLNWENMGSDDKATQSMIYNNDGTLKGGKQKWCATCHDQTEAGTDLVENFEDYTDDTDLQRVWKAVEDACLPTLREPAHSREDIIMGNEAWWVNGKFISVKLDWQKSTLGRGRVGRFFNPLLDLSRKDSFNFYMKLQSKAKLGRVGVFLRKKGTNSHSGFWLTSQNCGVLYDNVWKFFSLPRKSFSNNSDAYWGQVDLVQFVIVEKYETQDQRTSTYICLDQIGGELTGPNVIGDNLNSGYYKTGHKFYCTRCHDPSSKHIDSHRVPVLYAILQRNSPTNFRFYPEDPVAPKNQLLLPYPSVRRYDSADFALCYRCHDESAITTSARTKEDSKQLNTNFREDNVLGISYERNLHYYHVYAPPFICQNTTCVLCHDPHGQSNPAMTRKEMGSLAYINEDGCEIDRQADSDGDGKSDWYDTDPLVNTGSVQTVDWRRNVLCDACHVDSIDLLGQCGEENNKYGSRPIYSKYDRSYKILPHTGGMKFGPDCFECHGGGQSHVTHTQAEDNAKGPAPLVCEECHIDEVYKIDDMVVDGVSVCQNCHSPDGVQMAKDNWGEGVYNEAGEDLQEGKEEWCVSCHNDEPANSKPDGTGVSAPDVGLFYTSGHGRDGAEVKCLECHDAAVDHIDDEARTYAFDDVQYAPAQSGQAYASGYRLQYVNGKVPLMIPADKDITFPAANSTMRSQRIKNKAFRLCFSCHDSSKVLDEIPDINRKIDTNFKASRPNPPRSYSYAWTRWYTANEHATHVLDYTGANWWDSDWNGGIDSLTACSSCHNVHGATGADGSTNEAMIRDGSLAGRAGYGFSYVVEDGAGYPWVSSEGATQSDSVGAIFRNNLADTEMCGGSGCHSSPEPPGASYDASGSGSGTYLEYYRPWHDYSK